MGFTRQHLKRDLKEDRLMAGIPEMQRQGVMQKIKKELETVGCMGGMKMRCTLPWLLKNCCKILGVK